MSLPNENRHRRQIDHPMALMHQIETLLAVGAPLKWTCNESLNRAWIILNLPDLDPSQPDDWPRQQPLLAQKTVEFWRALDPFVQPLDTPPA